MSKRRTGRKLAMQALYQFHLQQNEMYNVLEKFIVNSNYVEETKNWATTLASGTVEHLPEIDALIKKHAIGWEIFRINPIDLSLLRLGIFEIQYLETPPSIVINEIIEIAKKYATEDSSKFINGILGHFGK